jgi:hypothetical protein
MLKKAIEIDSIFGNDSACEYKQFGFIVNCSEGRKFTSQMASYVLVKIIHTSFSMYVKK